jgi:hypothetical protein
MESPKEKAKELVDKFISYSYFSDGNYSMNRQYQQEDNSKQCALIAVDEILNIEHPQIIIYTEIIKNSIRDYFQDEYWDEVKKEIEKL